jgi:hypothetical protein
MTAPDRLVAALAVGVFALSGLAHEAYAQTLEKRPNLRALPAFDLTVLPTSTGGAQLLFSARTWNAGLGPLELVAGETGGDQQNIYQRIYLDNGSYYDRHAGTFIWHPAHNHFHFQNYATYLLQPVAAPGASERSSNKTTFCVMDTDKVNGALPGAPGAAVYSSCSNLIQGMSVGWADTYKWNLPGQAIDLTGWTDGDYKLTISADPKNQLVETDESDNVACSVVRIGIATGTATTVSGVNCDGAVEPPPPAVTVASITPNYGAVGTITSVTITGTGFTSGIAVSFSSGTGARPSASNVVVQNSTTITALVTVKKGKTNGDTVWNLKVGTAVLSNAFTIL